ncbi:MAG: hypothetical protein GY870_07845 [archaeon]|nr:hypothetical protein [archaeon]
MENEEKNDFKEQFKSIGLSLAKKAKKEVKDFRKKGNSFITDLNREFIEKVKQELFDSTAKFIKEYEYKLNRQISDNIKLLNDTMLQKKAELYNNFNEILIKTINEKIQSNYTEYKNFINKTLEKHIKMFNSEIHIQLNQNDQKIFNEISKGFKNKQFIQVKEPLNSIGGYIISNRENSLIIDETIENLLALKEDIINQKFGAIFPIYQDRRKSATDLMREQNISAILKTPEELDNFIEEHNIEMGHE